MDEIKLNRTRRQAAKKKKATIAAINLWMCCVCTALNHKCVADCICISESTCEDSDRTKCTNSCCNECKHSFCDECGCKSQDKMIKNRLGSSQRFYEKGYDDEIYERISRVIA